VVPVFAALVSFLVFGQALDLPMLAGMLIVAVGVWLARRP
jgi:drug/metabolite transporter (DMT)-like permease